MTTSIIDIESIKKFLPADLAAGITSPDPTLVGKVGARKPVSGVELIQRAAGLFTPEEADALGQRIEESCEQIDD